ncbi:MULTISPECIES: helix-turn-helix transcriptional regulator [Fusobacterium]|jgi:transposase|uniref:helix-turn-helix transcriptional regulator n=2 Tax=Fusobacteriaceae TaxID=203492 RepID=UPI000E89450F|nr:MULTISPECIES: helix-turn-helix domain-containing protein [Fusobacterium]DAE77822.1 MAG TPA: hypothetical protein [Caudoviricetes sp.]HBJ79741.1 hypothetical protein [Fusobacterium sp.]
MSKEKIMSYILQGKSNKEIAELCNVSVRTVERHRKKVKEATSDNDKKPTTTGDRKIKKQVAKVMIQTGASIREAADMVGLPKSTVGDISSKEKLQASQLEYLKAFAAEQAERIRQNKLKRLAINEEATNAIKHEISNWKDTGRISKAAMEKLVMTEELEQLILETDRIEKLEKLEIERKKVEEPKEKDTEITIKLVDK